MHINNDVLLAVQRFNNSQKHRVKVEDLTSGLIEKTQRLNLYNNTLMVLTLLLVFLTGLFFSGGLNPREANNLNAFVWIAYVMCLICIGMREKVTQQGQAIFEDLTDEVQWHLLKSTEKRVANEASIPQRPDLSIRTNLRQFVVASKLPFGFHAWALVVFQSLLVLGALLAYRYSYA